jgi:hypothetical protein
MLIERITPASMQERATWRLAEVPTEIPLEAEPAPLPR